MDTLGNGSIGFPVLRYVCLNRRLRYPLLKWDTRAEGDVPVMTLVQERFKSMSSHNTYITYVGLGGAVWVRSCGGTFIRLNLEDSDAWWANVVGSQFSYTLFPEL